MFTEMTKKIPTKGTYYSDRKRYKGKRFISKQLINNSGG